MKKNAGMTLVDAMKFVIKDDQFNGENRKLFSNKEAADTYSESLKSQWPAGKGLVYGPFVSGNNKWYEVSY